MSVAQGGCPVDVKGILTDTLKALADGGVSYCIVRNYESLISDDPYLNEDLDILVDPKAVGSAEDLLRKKGWNRLTRWPSSRWVRYRYAKEGSELLIDLHVGGLVYGDLEFYPGKSVLESRQELGPFYVPAEPDFVAMLLIHSIVAKGFFRPRYKAIIKNALAKGVVFKDRLEATLRSAFGPLHTKRIIGLLEAGDYEALLELRRSLLARAMMRQPARALLFPLYTRAPALRRLLSWRPWNRAPLIAIVGVDGAGKTTAAAALCRQFEAEGKHCEIVYMGKGRERVLPGVRTTASSLGLHIAEPNTMRNRRDAKSAVYSLFRDLVYLLDMYLRYLLRVLPRRWTGVTIITDRYAYDLFLHDWPTALLRFCLLYLYPKPTVLFYLSQPVEAVYSRRPEEDRTELVRQIGVFQRFLEDMKGTGYSRFFTVSSQTPEEALCCLREHLLSCGVQ